MAVSSSQKSFEIDHQKVDLEKEILAIAVSIDLERRKYTEYKIIKEVAFECTKSDCGLTPELQAKVYNILMLAEVEQSQELTNQCTLLGLNTETMNISLTYEEKEKLQEAVGRGLIEKHRNMIKELAALGFVAEKDAESGFSLSAQEKELVFYKRQLNERQEEYSRKLREFAGVLGDIVRLKTEVLPPAANRRIQASEVEGEELRLKIELLGLKAKHGIFAETSNSLTAYKELLKDIKKQQAECEAEIENLRELQQQYKQVSCKKYDEILKSYLWYKSAIEMKMRLRDNTIGK